MSAKASNSWYARYGKRLFDLVLTIPGLILISPILAVVALLVRIKLGSPVLFRQQRPGLNGEPFTIYKFRTMTDERDAEGNLLPNEQRLPRLGRILRTTSLDELPELFNVLKGEMSIVGPRPLLMDYLPLYTLEQARRHEVRGGITGLAQVEGRNALEFDDRFRLDVYYVDRMSLQLDINIIIKTLAKIVKQENIVVDERALRRQFESTNQIYTSRKGNGNG
ncbi:sugar transferase [Desulfovermiculus halophilus]|uniref:sugar transferase n=1 Tax=Desulfovermiculus halophilus TaxID=339722 RepID=UPI000684C014|nr:sugar transferase [Desulfovermiculus halophilus]